MTATATAPDLDALVADHRGLVVSIARKFLGRGLDFDELESLGLAGLLKAIERFDPDRGFKLSTYAGACIRSAIQDGLRTHRRATRARTNCGAEPDGEETTWDPADPLATPPDLQAIGAEDRDRIARALSRLDRRAATVIRLRFGLDGSEPMTSRQVGKRLKLTYTTIEDIERRALAALRADLGSNEEDTLGSNGASNGTAHGKPRFEYPPANSRAYKRFSKADKDLIRQMAVENPEASQFALSQLFESRTGRSMGMTTIHKILTLAGLRPLPSEGETPALPAPSTTTGTPPATSPAGPVAAELEAMARIAAAIGNLTPEAAGRALAWAATWKGVEAN